ncbi:hypothetical protein [Myxococcus faecalis]|uniref:hypothetical protein n=1 Tax=Myxococcus faecalis TaxID=3115646 RepID=UPI003CEFD27F
MAQVLAITATPVGPDSVSGAPFSVVYDAKVSPPGFGVSPVAIRADPTSRGLVLELSYTGQIASAVLSVLGASSLALRTSLGDLSAVEAEAFVSSRRLVGRPRSSTPGRIQFFIPTVDGTVPPDGVVIADVALQDPFGRTVHTSVVEFTNANSFDPLVSIQAQPGSLLINQVGRREQLNVFGNFAIAGEVNLSGGRHGVLYSSSNPTVVAVTQSGEVIALGQGDATIMVSYADHVTEVPVFVTDSSRIVATRIAPNTVTLDRVGATLQLKLEGLLDDPVSGRVVDLSPATLNTVWSSSDPTTVSISVDGKLTSRGVGSAAITATHTTAEVTVHRTGLGWWAC